MSDHAGYIHRYIALDKLELYVVHITRKEEEYLKPFT